MAQLSYDDIEESIHSASKKLGIDRVKEQQMSALKQFCKGFDVFCSLPTGYGKSFAFQAFHLICNKLYNVTDTLSLVIFPLRSLIDDQIAKLKEMGVLALYIDASTKVDNVINGKYSLLFATPETLVSGTGRGREILMDDALRQRVRGIFIDECHVITQWGFAEKEKTAFRRHYSQLADIRAMLPNIPLMALTATATVETRREILKNLAMFHVHTVEESPNRPNIKLVNVRVKEKNYEAMFSWLIKQLKTDCTQTEKCIIYCRTLQQCRDLYGIFYCELECKRHDTNLPFSMYHSESPEEVQQEIVSSFSREDGHIKVLFATVAFGMGVDVKNVHSIIHLGVPNDPASFLQESGRAGRDGKPSVSIMLSYPGVYQDSRDVGTSMKEYLKNTEVCRRKVMLNNFGYSYESSSDHTCCDVCAKNCKCDGNKCSSEEFLAETNLRSLVLDTNVSLINLPKRSINMDHMCELNERLSLLRLSQTNASKSANFLATEDLTSGIPTETVDIIVAEAQYVLTFEQFKRRYAIYSDYHDVWNVLCEVVESCPVVSTGDPIGESNQETLQDIAHDEFAIVCDEDDYNNEDIYNEGEFANAISSPDFVYEDGLISGDDEEM